VAIEIHEGYQAGCGHDVLRNTIRSREEGSKTGVCQGHENNPEEGYLGKKRRVAGYRRGREDPELTRRHRSGGR
jgi:hypothetical protein